MTAEPPDSERLDSERLDSELSDTQGPGSEHPATVASAADGTDQPSIEHPFVRSRFDFTSAPPAPSQLRAPHFLGIGGAGMSGIARLFLERGSIVSGSDAKDVAVLADLREAGARVAVGFDPSQLGRADSVVMSSAIRDDNVELVAARAAGLPVYHRSQALAALLADRVAVAVAGANGKTTTTSLLTVALDAAGREPSFASGGVIAQWGTNARGGTGDVFVVEADESDGSFVTYHPQVAVVTNVQADHLDFYGSVDVVAGAYRAFVDTIRPGGVLVVCADDPGSRALGDYGRTRSDATGLTVLTYGQATDADVRLVSATTVGLGAQARLVVGEEEHVLRLQIPGEYNLSNAAGAFTAAVLGLGCPPDDVLDGLAGFTGARRRFEPKGEANGVRVVDDYAHNEGKVTAVTRAAATIAHADGAHLVAVFQPHLYSRTRDFAAGFGRALAAADVVVVMDIYGAREDPIEGVSSALIVAAVNAARPGSTVHYIPGREAVARTVARLARPGDLVLTIGAGDITEVGDLILAELESRAAGVTP